MYKTQAPSTFTLKSSRLSLIPVAIVAGAQLNSIIPSFNSVGPNENDSSSGPSNLSSKGSW